MSEIEYFYSTHSVFAYLGSARFMEIVRAAGRKIVHRPIDLNQTVPAVGSLPFRQRSPKHVAYFFRREIDRWAEERGVPVMKGFPQYHHNDMAMCNGMIVAGVEQDVCMDQLAHAMLSAHWQDDADLADLDTLVRLAEGVDIDPGPLLNAALSEPNQVAYRANTEEAIERSVFGSPTYFVDDDMFYGQDRLEMVERALRKPYAPEAKV